jgi:uncharacterized protein
VIRAVIDTNVFVSGLLTPHGNEALIILAVHQGFLRPCHSTEMLTEYSEVLARPKFDFAPNEIVALLSMLREKGELVRPVGDVPALPDINDGIFLHCAETSRAEYIVTGNKRHFPQELCGAVRVVNAGELLDRITLEIRP